MVSNIKQSPLVSITCLTYNHAPYLRQCLDGFVMQKTSFPIEILIYDDASEDGTQDIIREYERKYPDLIKPIYQTENQYSKGVKVEFVYNYPRAKGKYIAFCEGDDYWTDPNKLQKQILEEFVPNFASGSELLYIGDTSDRTLQRDDKRLSELGIKILEDTSKLPDIILYDSDKNRIIYVEAYSSTGEFNKDRVDYINTYCSYKNDIEVAFVTAFATTKKMLQVYPKIAWDTEIWIAEEATHLTHKNGDRFMGRSPEEFL